MAPGFAPEQAALAAYLARIMMPFLLLVSLAAAAMGMLNAQGRFTAPAIAPALFNVGAIAVGLGLWAAGLPPERAVVGWSIGTLLGGVLQLAAQLPSLHAVGLPAAAAASPARTSRDPGRRADRPAHGRRGGRALRDAGEHPREHHLRLARGGREHLAPERLPADAAPARRLRRRHRDRGGRRRGAARGGARHGRR